MRAENEYIREGDRVCVNINVAQFTLIRSGEVLHVPCAIGDSWVIKDLEYNSLHYISEGCTITKSLTT